MGCPDSLTALQQIVAIAGRIETKIEQALLSLKPSVSGSYQDVWNGWSRQKVGNHWTYQQQLTYVSDPTTFDIIFPRASSINYIVQIWNDGTAKNFAIRTYFDTSSAYYSDWNTKTVNTDTSDILLFLNGLIVPANTRLRLVHSTLTLGKITTIIIQADELV